MNESEFEITVEEMFSDDYFLSIIKPSRVESYKKHGKLVSKVKKRVLEDLELVYEYVQYIAGGGKREAIIKLGNKRAEAVKDTRKAGRPSGSQQLYKSLSIEYLEGTVSKLDGYHTWYNVLYELELLHRKSGKVEDGKKYLGSLINHSLESNRQFFYSYQPFQLFHKVYNSSFMNKLWLRSKPQLVTHFREEIVSRSEKIFEDWLAGTQANYEKVYIANVKKLESDREHFSINTIYITKAELFEYKKWYAVAKNEINSEEEIMELCRKKFGFNYAYTMYRFFNNDHLPVLENSDELRQQIHDDLMSVLVNLSATRNHTRRNEARKKEEVPSYYEKFSLDNGESSWSFSFVAERMATDQWFYRLKRSREYLKVAHKVFGDVLEPKDDLKISNTKLKAKPAGLPECFSLYRGRFVSNELEAPMPFEISSKTFFRAKHRQPSVTACDSLFNTIQDIFRIDNTPFEWKSMIAVIKNGGALFNEKLFAEIGWIPSEAMLPDVSLYGGKSIYNFEEIQKAFRCCEKDIRWEIKNKDFKDDNTMFRYVLEIVLGELTWARSEKIRKKQRDEIAERQMSPILYDDFEEYDEYSETERIYVYDEF